MRQASVLQESTTLVANGDTLPRTAQQQGRDSMESVTITEYKDIGPSVAPTRRAPERGTKQRGRDMQGKEARSRHPGRSCFSRWTPMTRTSGANRHLGIKNYNFRTQK